MIKKKIVGIYVERDCMHYVSVVKGISSCSLKSPGDRHTPSHNIKRGNGHALLRAFLTELSVDSSRSIYLTLPRSEFFIREITLPLMPVEDALISIKNSLAIYSHLAPDDIYYDVIVSERNGGAFHALLVYAAKDEIEKYRKIFSETGHGESLKGIFPLSYGVCALIDDSSEPDGVLFSLVQEDTVEFFARSGSTLIFSSSCPVDAEDDKKMILSALQSHFPQCQGMVNDLSSDSTTIADTFKNGITADMEENDASAEPDIDQNSMQKEAFSRNSRVLIRDRKKSVSIKRWKKGRLSSLPTFRTNYASAAVAPLISKIQQISLDEEPVKINIVHPFRYIVPSLSILIVILYFITDNINSQSVRATSELSEITQQVRALERELEPLQNKIDTLKKASRFKTDVKAFMQTRPPIYTVINEIATLVPDGTWFANFTFNESGITLRGTGTDALRTVEALRSSDLFGNVMLRGSVNRRANGDENFTMVLELKPEKLADKLKQGGAEIRYMDGELKGGGLKGGDASEHPQPLDARLKAFKPAGDHSKSSARPPDPADGAPNPFDLQQKSVENGLKPVNPSRRAMGNSGDVQ